MDAINRSDKIVHIFPQVEVSGLGNLKKPLYLAGDNLSISENNISMVGKFDSGLGIYGDNGFINGNSFVNKSKNKSFTAVHLESLPRKVIKNRKK
jgi:hypothetical protein